MTADVTVAEIRDVLQRHLSDLARALEVAAESTFALSTIIGAMPDIEGQDGADTVVSVLAAMLDATERRP